jgi:hypothetical protein
MSVCIFHNGNRRIVEFYKNKFSYLQFHGNWAESAKYHIKPGLYEICHADASTENLQQARELGVRIVRHISTHADDLANLLPECHPYDQVTWLNNAVVNNLCFSDEIVCDFVLPTNSVAECVIITTGRTASSHLEQAWKAQGKKSFEHTRRIDQRFLNAESSVLNWREDQWECASSLWIMIASNRVLHNVKGSPLDNYDFQVPAITQTWIDNDWTNMSKLVLDHSLFFKYVLKKSVLIMPTEYVIEHYQSPHGKMSYEKNKIIQEYNESMSKYNSSNTRHLFNTLYNNTIRLLKD